MVTTSMTSYWAINNTQNFQDKKYIDSKLMLITRGLKKINKTLCFTGQLEDYRVRRPVEL